MAVIGKVSSGNSEEKDVVFSSLAGKIKVQPNWKYFSSLKYRISFKSDLCAHGQIL